MTYQFNTSFRLRILFALVYCAAASLLLNGCNEQKADGAKVRKEHLDLALREAGEAYAKATLDRGEQPQKIISVKQLLELGYLDKGYAPIFKNRDLLVAVDADPVEDFQIAAGDIEQMFVGDGSLKMPAPKQDGRQVCLKLTKECSDALRKKTGQTIGRKLRLRTGTATIIEANVTAEIPGPWLIVTAPNSTEANEIRERLKRAGEEAAKMNIHKAP